MPRAKCTACGAKLPAKSKFCPECGAPVGSGDTVVQELPPAEEQPTPVEPHVSERRFFGVPPSTLLLVLGVVGVLVAIALFVTGHWPWGLIALGLSMFVLTGFVSQVTRLPGEASAVSKAPISALARVRSRAGAAKETIAAHGSARIELARLRREASALGRERAERARELGEAVYSKNNAAAKGLKERIKEIDDEIEAKEAQMAKVTMDAMERIGSARLQVQATQIVPKDSELPDEAPEPVYVPEPSPAQVPEPYPPPDEGDRPRPPEIPEPTPNPGPE